MSRKLWVRICTYGLAFSVLVLIAGFLASCSEDSGAGIQGTHDATDIDITIRVKTFPTNDALNKHVGRMEHGPSYEVDGLAVWRVDAIGNVKRCDIYVEKPKSKFDYKEQSNWGHELMHCIYGSYHKDGER